MTAAFRRDDGEHGPAATPVVGVPRIGETLYSRYGKRAFDVVAALIGIVLLAPLLCGVTLCSWRSLGRPVLFRQVRLGRHARRFAMLKFRSMHHDRRRQLLPFDQPDRRHTHKSPNDPRHTPFGRFIRRTAIDELPQLFNVLRGEMSIVGPRPELPNIAELHGLTHHVRHEVRPGLTGLWQISTDRPGFVHENARYDEQYVSNITLLKDLAIIVKTIPVLCRSNGV